MCELILILLTFMCPFSAHCIAVRLAVYDCHNLVSIICFTSALQIDDDWPLENKRTKNIHLLNHWRDMFDIAVVVKKVRLSYAQHLCCTKINVSNWCYFCLLSGSHSFLLTFLKKYLFFFFFCRSKEMTIGYIFKHKNERRIHQTNRLEKSYLSNTFIYNDWSSQDIFLHSCKAANKESRKKALFLIIVPRSINLRHKEKDKGEFFECLSDWFARHVLDLQLLPKKDVFLTCSFDYILPN